MTIAALLAMLMRPFISLRTSPLAWRPGAPATRAANRLRSFAHAFAGLGFLAHNEPNMRIHLFAACAVIVAGVWFGIDGEEWRWLIAAMALVLAAEALNTAVEQACNAVTRAHRAEIKAAKDAAAAGVLIAAAAAALIGASVFFPRLVSRPLPTTLVCGDLR